MWKRCWESLDKDWARMCLPAWSISTKRRKKTSAGSNMKLVRYYDKLPWICLSLQEVIETSTSQRAVYVFPELRELRELRCVTQKMKYLRLKYIITPRKSIASLWIAHRYDYYHRGDHSLCQPPSCWIILDAMRLWIGYVGWRSFSHMYWSTGIPHEGSK